MLISDQLFTQYFTIRYTWYFIVKLPIRKAREMGNSDEM